MDEDGENGLVASAALPERRGCVVLSRRLPEGASLNDSPRFAHAYPAITWWVGNHGRGEVGYDEANRSFVRALDPGGLVWEGVYRYASLDDALAGLDTALAAPIREPFQVTLTGRNDNAERAGE